MSFSASSSQTANHKDEDPYRDGEINRLKSVHLDRKLSATARVPRRSTVVESPTGKVAQSSDVTSPALSMILGSSATDLAEEAVVARFVTSPAPKSNEDGGGGPDMEKRGQELATRCWNEDEEFLAKEKIAEWLGGP